ncbi:hypothetical protein NORO109296_20500 [Nocardiopsis rhodophaea]
MKPASLSQPGASGRKPPATSRSQSIDYLPLYPTLALADGNMQTTSASCGIVTLAVPKGTPSKKSVSPNGTLQEDFARSGRRVETWSAYSHQVLTGSLWDSGHERRAPWGCRTAIDLPGVGDFTHACPVWGSARQSRPRRAPSIRIPTKSTQGSCAHSPPVVRNHRDSCPLRRNPPSINYNGRTRSGPSFDLCPDYRPYGGIGAHSSRYTSIRVLPSVLGLTRSRSRNSATPSSYERSSSS